MRVEGRRWVRLAGCVALALAGWAAAASCASAADIAFAPLTTVAGFESTSEAIAWQTTDARVGLLRDVDARTISVPLPAGCSLVAASRDVVQVSCSHSDRYPQRSPSIPTPQVFALGTPGFAEVPGLGQFDSYDGVGDQWLVGNDCGVDPSPFRGCPGVYLNWHDGRRVTGATKPPDLDSPDLAPLPAPARPRFRVIADVKDRTHRHSLYVKPRGRPRYRVARCTLGCRPLLLTRDVLFWTDHGRTKALRLSDRQPMTVSVPPGTPPTVGLAATRRRAFLVTEDGEANTYRLLGARLPPAPASACRVRGAHTFVATDDARLFVRPTRSPRSTDGLFGCANDTGRQWLLGPLDPTFSRFIYAGTPRFFKLAGRYAGYLIEHTNPDTPRDAVRRETLRVKDLRTGRLLLDTSPLRQIDPGFVLHPSGAVAWTETDLTADTTQVRALDSSGLRLLDSGAGRDLSAVHSGGPNMVCWIHTGDRRCAALY